MTTRTMCFLFVCVLLMTAGLAAPAWAGTLAEDLQKARDIILSNASGDNPFGRGFVVALFQPVFLASMFCLGLWTGQMNDKIKQLWTLPVIVLAATLIGAFISAYHGDWKPQFDTKDGDFLSQLHNTDAVAVIVGLFIGAAVGMGFTVAPFVAIVAVAIAGLALGFSQTADLGDHKNTIIPFWSGFGLSGLLVNIFGIGFETFLQSINLQMVTKWAGFATVILSLIFGTKVF